jgi:hypothetical protein
MIVAYFTMMFYYLYGESEKNYETLRIACLRYQVLTAVDMTITAFCDIVPFIVTEVVYFNETALHYSTRLKTMFRIQSRFVKIFSKDFRSSRVSMHQRVCALESKLHCLTKNTESCGKRKKLINMRNQDLIS